jgi:hypothetical protein
MRMIIHGYFTICQLLVSHRYNSLLQSAFYCSLVYFSTLQSTTAHLQHVLYCFILLRPKRSVESINLSTRDDLTPDSYIVRVTTPCKLRADALPIAGLVSYRGVCYLVVQYRHI